MEDTSKTIAVIDKSTMLKRLRSVEKLNRESNSVIIPQTEINKIKDIVAQRICQMIKDLSIKYYMVVIPLEVLKEFEDAATKLTYNILVNIALSAFNVTISGESSDNIFDVAEYAYEKFNAPVNIISGDGNVVIRYN